jgi:DNA-binding CsgD family transcriptional regulator
MPAGLVGRDEDLARLRSMTEPVPGRRARLVLVEGEAGIGKTTLVHARADELRVRWAQGVDDGAPPFWVWRQLAPEVGVAGDRFAWHVALRELLTGGVLLVVDDVQWADEASLRVLRDLLRDPGCTGLVCCATCRSGESGPGWDAIGPDLLAGGDLERLTLRGLDPTAAEAVLRTAADRDLADDQVREAVAAAGGVPLLLRESGRLLATGAVPGDGGLPSVIVARVRRLGREAQRLLSAASILAEEFELPVVARLLDVPTVALLPAVTAALAAGLLTDAGTGRFRFAHGLVRTSLAAELPLQRAVALHRSAALALEDLHADAPSAVSAEIARHWAAVAVTGDRAPAVAWARRAGDDAARMRAHEEAARQYTGALTCGGATLPVGDRVGLLVSRGTAEVAAGRLTAAFATCREAVEVAAGRPELVAEVALVLDAVGETGWDRTLQEWCRLALDGLDEGETVLRARLLARRAEARFYSGDVAGGESDAAAAMALAGSDAQAQIAALRARQLTCSGPGHTAERHVLAARMTALGEQLRRPEVEMWGRLWSVDVCWERGDPAGVAAESARLRWCVEQQHSPLARWHLLVTQAALAQARGRFDHALDLGQEALRLMSGTGHAGAWGAWMSLLAVVGHHRGHDPAAFHPPPGHGTDTGEPRDALFVRLGPAYALADTGRLHEARHLYLLTGPPGQWDVPPYFTLPALATGAAVAVALDLHADVAWFAAALDRHAGGHVVGGAGTAAYQGPVDLHRGRCAAALDDLPTAERLLAAAQATGERIGTPGFVVEAAFELAAVRMRRRMPDEARTLLARIRPDAERLGMAPWTSRIDALLTGAAGPLTAREYEIAELVAQGRSNREIADALVLSHRTVGNHVQHILTKLGVANRSQITAWVLARGMSSPLSTSPRAVDGGAP